MSFILLQGATGQSFIYLLWSQCENKETGEEEQSALAFGKTSENVSCETEDVTRHDSKAPLPRKAGSLSRDGRQVAAGVFKAPRDVMMSFSPLMPRSLAEQNNRILITRFLNIRASIWAPICMISGFRFCLRRC